jgi:hypothetical protein
MDSRHRWQGSHTVLPVAALACAVTSAGLVVLAILGWIRPWLAWSALWASWAALTAQQYADLRTSLRRPSQGRGARFRFVLTFLTLIAATVVVVVVVLES